MSSSEWAVDAIATSIKNNATELTAGILFAGENKTIQTVTRSISTPPQDFYHIAVHDPSDSDFSKYGQNQLASPPRQFEAVIQIYMYDVFYPVGEEKPYEKAHQNFRRLKDRLTDFLATAIFQTGNGDFKYRLQREPGPGDRRISSRSTIKRWDQQKSYISIIVLTMNVERCG